MNCKCPCCGSLNIKEGYVGKLGPDYPKGYKMEPMCFYEKPKDLETIHNIEARVCKDCGYIMLFDSIILAYNKNKE